MGARCVQEWQSSQMRVARARQRTSAEDVMFGQTRDRRWTGRGPGAFTIAAVAAAAVAITSAAWPIGDSLAATRSLSSGTLIGKAPPVIAHWAPVPYRRAQLSVPGGW